MYGMWTNSHYEEGSLKMNKLMNVLGIKYYDGTLKKMNESRSDSWLHNRWTQVERLMIQYRQN